MWREEKTILAVRMYLRYATGIALLVVLVYMMVTDNPHTDHLLRILTAISAATHIGQGAITQYQNRNQGTGTPHISLMYPAPKDKDN